MNNAWNSHLIRDRVRKQELIDEIAMLRRRLELKGMVGDCVYEHGVSKLYQGMIREREQQVEALQARLY